MNFSARVQRLPRASIIAILTLFAFTVPAVVQTVVAEAAPAASAAKKKKKKKCEKGYKLQKVKSGKKTNKVCKKIKKQTTTPTPPTLDPGAAPPDSAIQPVTGVKITGVLIQVSNVKVDGNVTLEQPQKRNLQGTLTLAYGSGFTAPTEFTVMAAGNTKLNSFTETESYDSTQSGLVVASVTIEGKTDNFFLIM